MPSPTLPERQPLLGASKDPSRHVDNVDVEVGLGDSNEPAFRLSSAYKLDDEDKEEVRAISRPWKLLYALIFVLEIVGTGLFIKAFIDSGDVDVAHSWVIPLNHALGGRISGAAAMVLQVLMLMPLRTVMNHQYRYGSTTTHAIHTLYADGNECGITTQVISAALIQGPVLRFGDTAANAGVLALLASNPFMKMLPSLVKTLFVSLATAAFRILLTPIDTVKKTLQIQGRDGMRILKNRYDSVATVAASFAGHYPWFGINIWLEDNLPTHRTLCPQN